MYRYVHYRKRFTRGVCESYALLVCGLRLSVTVLTSAVSFELKSYIYRWDLTWIDCWKDNLCIIIKYVTLEFSLQNRTYTNATKKTPLRMYYTPSEKWQLKMLTLLFEFYCKKLGTSDNLNSFASKVSRYFCRRSRSPCMGSRCLLRCDM